MRVRNSREGTTTELDSAFVLSPDSPGLARQITEAFPWNEAPRYLIRDRDRAYGAAFTRRLRAMGIPAKILALAVEVIELQCCLLWCGSLFLCRFLGRRDADAIHALGQPASEKRQGTKSREGIRVA